MKKLIAATLVSCCSAMSHATIYTYENLGFHDRTSGNTSDLTITYNDTNDHFSFDLKQEHPTKDYSRIYVVFSDDGAYPKSTDLAIRAKPGDLRAKPFGGTNELVANPVVDFTYNSSENSYQFSGDLTDQLLRAGNTTGLFGDAIGIWLYGYVDGKYRTILDLYHGRTTSTGGGPTGVPEPSALLLIPIAFGMLLFNRRRRQA